MTEAEHEERLRAIAVETEEIKRQMMLFEFQHKKDIADSERRFEKWSKDFDMKLSNSRKLVDPLVKLVGLTYDELDEIDATLTETGIVLTRPRKRARINNR